jgi:hypothetical protein
MKIEICDETAHEVTVATLADMLRGIHESMPDMELEDIITMSRTTESIMGVLRYMCTHIELKTLLRQS